MLTFGALAHSTNQTLSLPPAADTSLFETTPTNNLGASLQLIAGSTGAPRKSRALLRFPVRESLPTNITVSTVDLKFTVVMVPGNGVAPNSTFTLHRLLKDWGEGDKSGTFGSGATANEATWLTRFFPGTEWAEGGGKEGVDYVAQPSASVTTSNVGTYFFENNTNITADVNLWLEKPELNFGWMIRTVDESIPQSARRIASREDSTNAPALIINYAEFHSDTPIEALERVGTFMAIHVNIHANQTYKFEYSPNIATNSWTPFISFSPETYFRHEVLIDPIGTNLHKFYRLKITGGNTNNVP